MRTDLLYKSYKSFKDYSLKRVELSTSPLIFMIDINNTCNLKCFNCPQSNTRGKVKRGTMQADLFVHILNKIKDCLPIRQITLYINGEPLLHPELGKFIKLTNEILGIKPLILTNAVLLNETKIKEIVDNGTGSLMIDFSADKEEFIKSRDNADWDMVYNNIKNLVSYRDSNNKINPFVSLIDICTSRRMDKEERMESLNRLKSLFRGINIDRFGEYKLHNWSGEFAEKLKNDKRFNLRNRFKYHPCSHIWFTLPVGFDGRTMLCCRDGEMECITGDITKQSVMEIWNGEKFKEIRRLQVEKRYKEIPLCSDCDRLFTGSYIGGNPIRMFYKILNDYVKYKKNLKKRLKNRI